MRAELNKKVFFIISNPISLDDKLEYSLKPIKNNFMTNLTKITSKLQKYRKEDFRITLFSFDFINKNLENIDYDKEIKRYKAIIKLKDNTNINNKKIFEGIILFNENKNNFIYDFKFEDYLGFIGTYSPPPIIELPLLSQLKIYVEALKELKIKENESLFTDLILDSENFLMKSKYNIDLYLEIFKLSLNHNLILNILMDFNLDKVNLPDNDFNSEEYSNILKDIEKIEQIIIKYCDDNENPEKYLKQFYCLLLYFRANFEKVPEELLNLMTKKAFSYKQIIGCLFYLGSLESILIYINQNCDLIYDICMKEKKKIEIYDLISLKSEENFEIILREIEKLVEYESYKVIFVVFNEKFFKDYINYYFKKDLKKLLLIKKSLLLCKKLDKELIIDYDSYMQETAIEMIKSGELKNLELLEFIEKVDIYFIEDKINYKNLAYRPLILFDGFDIERMDEIFFEKWQKINIFKKYSYTGDKMYAEKYIIDKVNDMKYLGKLLKLFYFDNEELLDRRIINLIIGELLI